MREQMSDVVPGGIRLSTKYNDLCFPSFSACSQSSALRSVTREETDITWEHLQTLSSPRQRLATF